MDLSLLQSHRMLEDIPPPALQALAQNCHSVLLTPGQVLLRPGEPNHTLYFLLTGQLRIHLDSLESGNSFSMVPGEVLGEMSLIERRPASAWAVAAEATTLLAMPEQVFWEDFLPRPAAGRKLLQLLIDRMRRMDTVVLKELEHKVRYEHLQRELESAGKIQANILPALPLFPKHPQVEAHAFIKPARQVGGDFFDAFPLNDHCVFVAVGDVSGKGMAAALFMVRVITLLRMCLMREPRPEAVLPALNRMLCEANEELMFVTLGAALLDTDTGGLTYLNGGHNPPFVSAQGQPFGLWAAPRGTLLGIKADAEFATREVTLLPGDTLVLYTDGVSEAENLNHELFLTTRAADALVQAGPRSPVKELIARLEAAIANFTGAAPQSDDITILALRYLGGNGSESWL